MSTDSGKKLILVIGATGAQGLPVVHSLLAPAKDGSESPWAVRALTRDPTSSQAQQLKEAGAELFVGSFTDTETIKAAYSGCYGVFVNTDTFTVGPKEEIYTAIQLFEHAHREKVMRHFVWSGLDYGSKLGKYDPKYKAHHLDAKGIVSDFLRIQPSESNPEGEGLTWSIVTTGPYIEGLGTHLLGPLKDRDANGAVVFAIPLRDGHAPVISLRDIGWWVRYTFDHRQENSGKELKIATEMLSGEKLAETFTRLTGIPSIYKRMDPDEYLNTLSGIDRPFSPHLKTEVGLTIRETFRGMYWTWGDDLLDRDMEWLRKVHPEGYTLESWIRDTGYDGSVGGKKTLKNENSEDISYA